MKNTTAFFLQILELLAQLNPVMKEHFWRIQDKETHHH